MSKHPSNANEQDKLGPDYFSYFKREVLDLLSQEDILPSPPHNSQLSLSSTSFGDSIGPRLSDFKKEKLKVLLRQSAVILSKEVNEILGPALSIQHLKSCLRSKANSENVEKLAINDVEQAPFKKLKSLPYSTSLSAQEDCANLGSSRVIDEELQFFLENDSKQIEEIVTELSNELSGTLGHMEQQLEEVLDSVISNCRPMTFKEKEQLQKLIQELPPENCGRVAEIIQHRTDETNSSDEIYVDLDKENNITLWRLYYYVEAVEKAKNLVSG
ncbi:uncharacterized protein LOC111019964 [Momordica charantia]|uniref:Uncharacterized protein LOC111019964 n=1 Tax=Momordica charantia TaxID=3673 RepID=A0A6J1DGV0_MOMCH|nr:uncharacterized protein LOC111019964 [Momordica charantia]XP_022152182.1 uncharacterized protein LOC111019964 [Momordica charantia]